jgi:hypothetical protein
MKVIKYLLNAKREAAKLSKRLNEFRIAEKKVSREIELYMTKVQHLWQKVYEDHYILDSMSQRIVELESLAKSRCCCCNRRSCNCVEGNRC